MKSQPATMPVLGRIGGRKQSKSRLRKKRYKAWKHWARQWNEWLDTVPEPFRTRLEEIHLTREQITIQLPNGERLQLPPTVTKGLSLPH